MKKLIAGLLSCLMMMSLMTGGGSKEVTVEGVQDSGKLVIATSPDFPPFESLSTDGKMDVVGIEIDIMELICEKLGVELEVEQLDFESVLSGVQAGKYQAGASGISVTPKRAKNTLFTEPYCLAAQAIVVPAESPIQSKNDLDGKKIAVQTGTTAETFCMENGYEISSFAANNDAQSALLTDKVDAWVIDDLTAAEMVEIYNTDHPEALKILDEALTTEPYAFAFAPGSEELVAEVNAIQQELLDNGTIAEIFEKYNAPYTAPDGQ